MQIADTDVIELLMWGVQVRAYWEEGFNTSTDFNLKTLPSAM
jgi:hypothetical protein